MLIHINNRANKINYLKRPYQILHQMNDFIKCIISKRGSGINATPTPNYHVKAVYKRHLDMDEIARRISNKCSLTTADVIACLNALNEEVLFQLKDGNKVDLGWLGSFKLGLETKAHPTPENCSTKDIQRVKVNYLPNKKMKKELNTQLRFKIEK